MNNYNIVALPPTLVEVLWDKIVPHLKKAIEISNGELTEEGIKEFYCQETIWHFLFVVMNTLLQCIL